MNGLTSELYDMAAELAAAGVPATVDPGQVLAMVTRGGVCALVEPAEQVMPGMGLATLELRVPIRVITFGTLDLAAVERLDAALLLALPVALPAEPVTRDTWDAADTAMPCLLITARRRIPYPPAVHP